MVSMLVALSSCAGETSRKPASGNPAKKEIIAKMENKDTADVLVDITTTMGDIRVRLFSDTPRHRDNFVKLVKEGTYNGTLFHRVINEFMIQAGDPDSKNAK